MRAIRPDITRVCKDERGYTLPEILTAVSIMGIILAVGIIILLALLERWRVVFMHDGTSLSGCSSADYCMVKLNFPYGAGDPTPALADDAPLVRRELPDRTKYQGSHLRS
jgi:prepilin-type N-terminal cleavage/methylation domain-containing protein